MVFTSNKLRRSMTAFLVGSFTLAASAMSAPAQETAPINDNALSIPLDDYTSHPLAGTDVNIEIEVKDALNQTGQSRTITVRLPTYNFVNDMNNALADMRRIVALDWTRAPEIAETLDQFITDNASKIKDATIVESLTNIRNTLARSANIDELDTVIARDMWQVMMALEQDVMPQADQDLRAAEEALRQALEEGVSAEDLQKLLDDAQQAMEDFLQQQLDQAQQSSEQSSNENSESSDQQQMSDEDRQALEDMQKMLEEMREMMKELGLTPEQQAEMMQQMMQNMQNMSNAQSQQQQQQSQASMQQQMQQMMQQMQQMQDAQEMSNELEDLIKQQQDLMDQSADMADMTEQELRNIQEQLLELANDLNDRIDAQTDIESQKDEDDPQVARNLRVLGTDNTYVESQQQILQNLIDNDSSISAMMAEIMINRFSDIKKRLDEMQEDEPQEPQQNQDGQQGQDGQQQEGQQQQPQTAEERMQQLMDQLKNMSREQRSMQQQIRDMTQRMQQMGMHPQDLMDTNQHMNNSANDLQRGQPGASVPDQNQAIQSMRSAQEQLQQMMQQMMMGGAGAPQSGYGGPREEAPHAPLGRSNPNEVIGINPADNANVIRRQRDEIRNQLEQGNMPSEQRLYLERLLNGLTPSSPTP